MRPSSSKCTRKTRAAGATLRLVLREPMRAPCFRSLKGRLRAKPRSRSRRSLANWRSNFPGDRVRRNTNRLGARIRRGSPALAPDKFYKRESEEEHFAGDRIVSWLPAPVIEQDVFSLIRSN